MRKIYESDYLIMSRLEAAIKSMAATSVASGDKVIDIGCGSMPYKTIFQQLGATYTGADFAGGDINISPSGHVAAADAYFDIVVSFQVLEHVSDLGMYFSEVRRVLRPGGRLLLSTHGSWLYHPHPEDHRRWTRPGLIAELARAGFHVTSCEPLLGPLAWTTVLRSTGMAFFLKKIPVLGRPLAGALSTLLNVRAVLEDALTPRRVIDENACVYLTCSERTL